MRNNYKTIITTRYILTSQMACNNYIVVEFEADGEEHDIHNDNIKVNRYYKYGRFEYQEADDHYNKIKAYPFEHEYADRTIVEQIGGYIEVDGTFYEERNYNFYDDTKENKIDWSKYYGKNLSEFWEDYEEIQLEE